VLATVGAAMVVTASAGAQSPREKVRHGFVEPLTDKWTGDLDGMIQRRLIRILTVYSRTVYFVDNGVPRGTAYDQGKLLEEFLNKNRQPGQLAVSVHFLPVSRDELLPWLLEGRGDIVMAHVTVTPERLKTVDFTDPWIAGVDEIVVTKPDGPALTSVDDLSGREVFVRQSSSYYQSLLKLNERFASQGKPQVKLTPAPEELEDEDLMEMANAGLVDILIVDNHSAWFWQRIWPKLRLYPTIAVRTGGEIAWAIRKDSPGFKTALNEFLAANGKESLTARMIFRRYLLNTQFVRGAGAEAATARFRALVALFKKYGAQYNLDWMLMAAQGYQESRLNQAARSHVGAIGIMQVMPETGATLKVGDIAKVDPNIHAGVKYVRFMVDQYYAKEPMDEIDKILFAFASYNAGPGRLRALRREAMARSLDPNVWFNNVERIAIERIGRETATYVSNIYKYYVAYLLVQGEYLQRRELKQKTVTGRAPS
jgi:membrane-bound lytic murein transglycosylase MltF